MSKSLKDIYLEKGKTTMDDLLNSKRVTIYEKLDGINFGFVYSNGNFSFFKKNPKSTIGSIDRVLTSMYDQPINYINELDKSLFDGADNWVFSFDYFPNTNPSTIKYESQPKNNLVLNYIDDGNGNKILDKEILDVWADRLEVGRCPIIFDGKFTLEQIEKIFQYLNYTADEIQNKLQGLTFTEWLYSIINPNVTQSTLNSNLKGQIDSLFFRFENQVGDIYYGNIKNPYIEELIHTSKKNTNIDHNYYIILSDILDYLMKINIDKIKLTSVKFEDRYVELISNIFNRYMKVKGDDYSSMVIQLPEYLNKEFNKLNINLIKDKTTLEIMRHSKISQDIFRIFLSSFRRKRTYANFIFTDTMNDYFNRYVDIITDMCSYEKEDGLIKESFITFDEFERIYINGENSEDVLGVDLETVLRNQPDIVLDEIETEFNSDTFLSSIFVETEKRHSRLDSRVPVNLIIDVFAPFTKSIDEFVEYTYKETGVPFVIICIKNQGAVFTQELQERAFKSMLEKGGQYVDYIFVSRPNLRKIVNSFENKYRVNKIYSSSKFMKLINVQVIDNFRNNNILDFVDNENGEIAEYYANDDSIYNQITTALYNTNFTEFKKYAVDEYSNLFNEFVRKFNGY